MRYANRQDIDGVLLIDKPAGPTSHDVVARIRRVLGMSRVGHTGTLDPLATGLLVLVIGRATKLAAYLTAGDKSYEATIRLGAATATDDGEGQPIGELQPVRASDEEVRAALDRFRGAITQVPPAHSAKKVAGERAYTLARRAAPLTLDSVPLTVHELTWVGRDDNEVRVRVTASAGFYVRALARDLGAVLGCGGHLAALRRTASRPFTVAHAVPLDVAEGMGASLPERVIPPDLAVGHLAAVSLTDSGWRRARNGNILGPEHIVGQHLPPSEDVGGLLRVLSPAGRLVALARCSRGALHPVVVLG